MTFPAIRCFKCKQLLTEFGGLLFSPPNRASLQGYGMVKKYHTCEECFWELVGE